MVNSQEAPPITRQEIAVCMKVLRRVPELISWWLDWRHEGKKESFTDISIRTDVSDGSLRDWASQKKQAVRTLNKILSTIENDLVEEEDED